MFWPLKKKLNGSTSSNLSEKDKPTEEYIKRIPKIRIKPATEDRRTRSASSSAAVRMSSRVSASLQSLLKGQHRQGDYSPKQSERAEFDEEMDDFYNLEKRAIANFMQLSQFAHVHA